MTCIEEGYDPSGSLLLPDEVAERVRAEALALGKPAAFGALKVAVRVGASRWNTSLAPVKGGGWFLPIKKAVRIAESLHESEPVQIELELL
jgi:hypothetical protein